MTIPSGSDIKKWLKQREDMFLRRLMGGLISKETCDDELLQKQ